MSHLEANRIAELVVEALERTAFLITDSMPPEAEQEFDRPTWFSTIDYTGSAAGSIFLSRSPTSPVSV